MTPNNRQFPPELDGLPSVIQHNCHISDAHSAGDYTICVYLLKMRELYRWEKGFNYGDTLSRDAIGEWLTGREAFWEQLEGKDFSPLLINGEEFDPFDSSAINRRLEPYNLLYGAGYGQKAKPHFFLAELEKTVAHNGYRIHVTSREYARDLTAPPAMSLDNTIYIRRESLRRMLWERLEEWRWNKPDNAMGRAIRYYDFDGDQADALDKMTDIEIDSLILHEIGEVRAGELLGDHWHDMLASFPRSRLELMVRAVRDHLADALSTLPALLEQNHPPSLHFYFANLGGMRKQLSPALLNSYEHWVQSEDTSALEKQISDSHAHWLQLARELLELHRQAPDDVLPKMEALIESHYL